MMRRWLAPTARAAGTSSIPGVAWAWGYNSSGQLGNHSTADSPTPVAVAGAARFAALGGGWDHSIGLASDKRPTPVGGPSPTPRG